MCKNHSGSWYKVRSSAQTPPCSGWVLGSKGKQPAPQLVEELAAKITEEARGTCWFQFSMVSPHPFLPFIRFLNSIHFGAVSLISSKI